MLLACSDDGTQSRADDGPGISTGGLTADDGASLDDTAGGAKLDFADGGDLPSATGGEECVAQTQQAEVELVPIDVILVVDTSNSMAAAIDAVEASINTDFAAILGLSGIDYRVIVLGDYPPGEQLSICITAPLAGTDCNPPPAVPAVTAQYQHYDAITGSGAFLDNIVAWYTTPDPHGLAPNGYVDLLRAESLKIFLAMTDGSSASGDPSLGDAFDTALLNLAPAMFGTPGDRQYVFHSIISMPVNNPSTDPWLAADPIAGNGGSIQQVSIVSGGWRFPLSEAADFDVVFQQIAEGVVATTPVACSFPIPDPPPGETIDPDTIEIDYLPQGMPPAMPFHQVVGPADCTPDAFYIDAATVFLCPDACALVQADNTAALDVRYGCDVGFDPAG
jgi:hypothetical protein